MKEIWKRRERIEKVRDGGIKKVILEIFEIVILG
jgi:hypothetical protein